MSVSSGNEEADAVHHRIILMDSKNRIQIQGLGGHHSSSTTVVDDVGGLNSSTATTPSKKNQLRYSWNVDEENAVTEQAVPESPSHNPVDSMKPSKAKDDGTEPFGFDWIFFKRFYRLHGFLFISVTSLSTLLFLFLLAICLLQEYIVFRVGLIASRFYKVLADKDLDGFWSHMWYSVAIIFAVAFVKSTNQYVQKVLTVTWRQLLCQAVHKEYFSNINFYQLNVLDKSVDNPDQRMTQDIDKFCTTYCEVLPKLMISPFIIAYYCYQAYVRSGWQGPLGCFGLFVVATIINKLLMSPIVRYVMKQEQCEGDFRFIHMLIRVNSESIAFHNASLTESTKVNETLDKLLKTQHRLYCRQFFLNFSINIFDYFGGIFSYLILAIPIFSGKYDHLTPSDLGSLISQNAFVLIYLIYTFTSLVDISGKITDIAGVAHRIAQLLERLNTLGDLWSDMFPDDMEDSCLISSCDSLHMYDEYLRNRNLTFANGHSNQNWASKDHAELLPAWTLRHVSYAAPTGKRTLIKDLSLNICVGESILIVGSSSVGKSSFLRVLRGLWPQTEGVIRKHFPPGPGIVFYCPQKPYLTFGTLRDQICFPLKSSPSNQSREYNLITHYFGLLRLTSLVERIGGLDVPVSWNLYDSLSPGEMQRLCFVRVFFHRPLIVVLDEATSALPLEMEDLIYSECKRLDITTISIGHRASLRQYHDKLLTFHLNGSWSISNLRDDDSGHSSKRP